MNYSEYKEKMDSLIAKKINLQDNINDNNITKLELQNTKDNIIMLILALCVM